MIGGREAGEEPSISVDEIRGAPVALVTAGATGLGLEVSRQLAAGGFRIVAGWARSEEEAVSNVQPLRAAGAEVSLYRIDVTVAGEVEQLVDAIYRDWGRLDVVVNSAGITRFVPYADLKAMDEAAWDEVMDVNLKGTYLVCRAAAMRMLESGGGAIVNISSTAGLYPGGSSIGYAVSKAGVLHLTKALAVALAPKIRVNAVAPYLMRTVWWSGHDEQAERNIQATRFRRATDVEDAARTVVMLATNQSISGQTLVVDLANVFH